MIHRHRWISTTILLGVLQTANVQFAMPMFAPPPPPPPPMMVMAPPPPPPPPVGVPMPYPVAVPIFITKRSTTTTTTTPSSRDDDMAMIPVAIPFPMFPMPFALPQAPPPRFCAGKPRSKQCPPCPPCVCAPNCTPSFYSFCSPCHQKCRCRGGNAPMPLPPVPPPPPVPLPMLPPPMPVYPMAPGPPPVIVFPIPPGPPPRRPPRRASDYESSDTYTDTDTDTDTDSSSYDSDSDSYSDSMYLRKRKKNKSRKRPYNIFRSNARRLQSHDDGIKTDLRNADSSKMVKPMLTYISEQGNVKFEKRISEDDAAHLMRDTDQSESMEISRRSFDGKDMKVSGFGNKNKSPKDSRQVIFRPPLNKSITNLSLSFNVV